MKAIFLATHLLFASLAYAEAKQFVIKPSDHFTIQDAGKFILLPQRGGLLLLNGCSKYLNRYAWGRYLTVYGDFNGINSFEFSESIRLRMEFSSDRECNAFWNRFLAAKEAVLNIDTDSTDGKMEIVVP